MRLLVAGSTEFIGGHLTERFVAYGCDVKHTYTDRLKTSDLLGYEPSQTIRESTTEFVEWNRPLTLES
jgi:nucleoside-diphosphate-sugar epimerase